MLQYKRVPTGKPSRKLYNEASDNGFSDDVLDDVQGMARPLMSEFTKLAFMFVVGIISVSGAGLAIYSGFFKDTSAVTSQIVQADLTPVHARITVLNATELA